MTMQNGWQNGSAIALSLSLWSPIKVLDGLNSVPDTLLTVVSTFEHWKIDEFIFS
jgi:hypothetical protein